MDGAGMIDTFYHAREAKDGRRQGQRHQRRGQYARNDKRLNGIDAELLDRAQVQRMVRDLNFSVKIVVAPILREPDGVAMSSRNKYLEGELRTQAEVLWRSIEKVRADLRKSPTAISAASLKTRVKGFIEREPAARLDYVEFFDSKTLIPVTKVNRGAHMALAVFIGKTRLIDNARL